MNALAGLIRVMAGRWGIPLDREHIIGHFEVNSVGKPNCPSADHGIMDRIVSFVKGDPVVQLKAEIQTILNKY